jgi:hypothetical protein
MGIDIDKLVVDMKDAATQILKNDVSTLRGFEERQVKAIAQQAAFVEAGILSGQITEETRDFFLNGLEDAILNFVKTGTRWWVWSGKRLRRAQVLCSVRPTLTRH